MNQRYAPADMAALDRAVLAMINTPDADGNWAEDICTETCREQGWCTGHSDAGDARP